MQKYVQKIVNLTLFTAVLIGSVALANSDENKDKKYRAKFFRA